MKILSKPFFIAGVKFATEASRLTPRNGIEVTISHNPENAFDPFALVAKVDGVMIGHIPRQEQACWFYHTLNEVNVRCKVVNWDRNQPPYEEIQVQCECHPKYIGTVIKVGHLISHTD